MIVKNLAKSLRYLCTTKRIEPPKRFKEPFNRTRTMFELYDLVPFHVGHLFVAPNAVIIGDVAMGNDIVILHGAVLRGDVNKITYTPHN